VKHLANEYGKNGVRFNCVMPSAIRSEYLEKRMSAEEISEFGKTFPLGRIGEPDDVAQATAFLLSDAAAWIAGVTLDIAGGRLITY
jgi:3-oxoacyl-[acyl-carrier protein] reductase